MKWFHSSSKWLLLWRMTLLCTQLFQNSSSQSIHISHYIKWPFSGECIRIHTSISRRVVQNEKPASCTGNYPVPKVIILSAEWKKTVQLMQPACFKNESRIVSGNRLKINEIKIPIVANTSAPVENKCSRCYRNILQFNHIQSLAAHYSF